MSEQEQSYQTNAGLDYKSAAGQQQQQQQHQQQQKQQQQHLEEYLATNERHLVRPPSDQGASAERAPDPDHTGQPAPEAASAGQPESTAPPGELEGAAVTELAGQVHQRATTLTASPVDRSCRYRPQKYCAVCGDKAIACNFNAVTCESCKAFFRRNAFKEQRLKCLFDNCCFIDRVTRRFCSKCRLLKCFQIGMKREWILTDEQKQIKRVKIMQNKRCRLSQSDDEQEAGRLSSASPSRTQQKQRQQQQHQVGADFGRARVGVQTRDAATSCPEEHGRLLCSVAAECQYCSLRIAGHIPSNQHQHQRHHHHPHLSHLGHQSNGASPGVGTIHPHLSPHGYHQIPALDEASQFAVHAGPQHGPRSAAASRAMSLANPAMGCCCLDPGALNQPTPQLHLMTPSQAPMSVLHLVGSPESVSYGVFQAAQQLSSSSSSASGVASVEGGFSQASGQYAQYLGQQLARPDARQVIQLDSGADSDPLSNAPDEAELVEPSESKHNDRLSAEQQDDKGMISAVSPTVGAGRQLHCEPDATQTSPIREEPLGSTVVWNGELYLEPAFTELDLRERLEKLHFLEEDRSLIVELIEATRFMFEISSEHKSQGSLHDIVHLCDYALRRLIKTVKQIKTFRTLDMDDQIILVKAACFKILLLRSAYHYMDSIEGWKDLKTSRIMRLDILKRATKSSVYDRHSELVIKIPEPLRKDRLIMSIMSMVLLFDPNIDLKHANSVSSVHLIYLRTLREYLFYTQPAPLSKYQSLVSALKVINACNEEYNVFFSKDFQPEQITPLLIEIFDISTAQ